MSVREIDVDYDEDTNSWCVFVGERVVASYAAREDAKEKAADLQKNGEIAARLYAASKDTDS